MATGYTAAIKDGIEFEDFVMKCARAMGACVTMGDDPSDIEIPVFEPSDYHKKRIAEETDELHRLKRMCPKAVMIGAKASFDRRHKYRTSRNEESEILRSKYESMLERVGQWNPPSTEHVGFKAFMSDQITQSIDFDCHTDESEVSWVNAEKWHAHRISEAERSLRYSENEHKEEVLCTRERNKWVSDLRGSFA